MIQTFIVVDDDSVNNIFCKIIIEEVFAKASIQTFTDPEAALVYINSAYANKNASDTILFLDINMPTISGWEFLDAFEKFDAGIKDKLRIYMLSSSLDPRDKERAGNTTNALDYIEKPLTRQCLEELANKA